MEVKGISDKTQALRSACLRPTVLSGFVLAVHFSVVKEKEEEGINYGLNIDK